MPSQPILPRLKQLTGESSGVGFFLCVQKDVRQGRAGDYVSLTLQDSTGRVTARIFDDVERLKGEFDAGEFVKVRARGNLYNERIQLIVENIRRVHAEQDRKDGFREEDCVLSSPRPLDEMWAELQAVVRGVGDPSIRQLLEKIVCDNEAKLRVWPAAQVLHHAYRGGFLEHVLKIAEVVGWLCDTYGANRDVALAGALLHDIGKLEELDYGLATRYSREGRLVGHIALGVQLVREAASTIDGFPPPLLTELEHLVLSHHGCLEFGSPVVPMTVEAFILSFADDLDAKIHMARQALRDEGAESEFTAYHARLERVLWRGPVRPPAAR
ncbi:MAG TPA: HD domain-containing protein [Vicinamibacterales bacterium]|nr:HD domain-containing protein [Vicinamibacterales bacterium]